MHTKALAAGAGAQGFSLENGQAPLVIAPRDVSHGTDEGHIFPTGEAGEGSMLVLVLLLHAHQSVKERQKTHFFVLFWFELGWRQDNGNRSNQKSKFDFLATRQGLGKIDEGQ